MKPYLLFYGSCYYACGGWADFKGEFDTIEEAHAAFVSADDDCMDSTCQWSQIVCTKTKAIVVRFNREYCYKSKAHKVTKRKVKDEY